MAWQHMNMPFSSNYSSCQEIQDANQACYDADGNDAILECSPKDDHFVSRVQVSPARKVRVQIFKAVKNIWILKICINMKLFSA